MPLTRGIVLSADSNRARMLLGLELATLAIGVAHFALTPDGVKQPLIVAITLVLFASAAVTLRLLGSTHRSIGLRNVLHVVLMLLGVCALAWLSSSSAHWMNALYALPVASAAVAFARWWSTLLVAIVAAGCAFLIGALTPGVQVYTIEFAMGLFGHLAPGVVVALMLTIEIDRGQRAARQIQNLSSTDALTGVLNLRAFESALQQAHAYAERRGAHYSILMIDVDNLSQVNDSAGHEAGSQVLNAVAAAIMRSVRRSDVVARFGGDEFIVLCTHATTEIAASIAQRIRNNVYASTVSTGHRLIRANVSVGAVNYPEDRLHPKDLLMLASQRMQEDRELRKSPANT